MRDSLSIPNWLCLRRYLALYGFHIITANPVQVQEKFIGTLEAE